MPNATAGLLSVRPHLAGSASGLGSAIMIGGGAALSVFGVERRKPGANLPNTSLVGSLSGVMSLDSATLRAAEPTAATSNASVDANGEPDEIRFQLAGFQSGTRRADEEN